MSVLSLFKKPEPKVKAWHAAAFLAATDAFNFLISNPSSQATRDYYESKKEAKWAPPAWVFGPAWAFNNITRVAGDVKLLNEKDFKDKKTLLALQSLMWGIYVSYSYFAFKKKSTLLSAAMTTSFGAAAIASLIITAKHDKKIAALFVPSALWGAFASSVAIYDAAFNEDEFFGTKAPFNKAPIALLEPK